MCNSTCPFVTVNRELSLINHICWKADFIFTTLRHDYIQTR